MHPMQDLSKERKTYAQATKHLKIGCSRPFGNPTNYSGK